MGQWVRRIIPPSLYGWLSLFVVWLLSPILAGASAPGPDAASSPLLWRQLTPGFATTKAAFQLRTPQFVLYQNGALVYRSGTPDNPSYMQVRLTPGELFTFLAELQRRFHLSGLTPQRLAKEEPYITAPNPPRGTDASGVVIWIGTFGPPRMLRVSAAVLKARAGRPTEAPAWGALNDLNQFLAQVHHSKAQPLTPDLVELAVQPLPSHMTTAAASSARWPLTDVSLREILGGKSKGFRTLTGKSAQIAYQFLMNHPIATDGGTRYDVWVRPLLLP